ncbi:MAG: hypothetical protein Q4C73_03150 [Eubacteriales bacterium]|nr:hypothetical protein [Eubacteriales bacterium]
MGLTAKEFARLSDEEKRKRYNELDNVEASRYRIHHEPVWGKSTPLSESPVQYTPEEEEKLNRNLFALEKQFHRVPEDMTFDEWMKGVQKEG